MNPDNDLFTRLGVLYLDHLAVTTPELNETLGHYLSLPGARLLRGPADNPAQRVRYAFVGLTDTTVIEILAPLEASPIAHHLARGGGAYHLCYAVADLEHALDEAVTLGARRLVEPTPDPAFDGRRIAFLHHRAHGLFELVEAYPSRPSEQGALDRPREQGAGTASPPPTAAPPANRDGDQRLATILLRLFPSLADGGIEGAAMDRTEGWDSASHLVLMMEIEEAFDIDIPSERIAEATDYPRLVGLIGELTR